jgi:hypothetical protein
MMSMGGGKSEYIPQLGNGPPVQFSAPLSKWWDQVVMVLNSQRITRRDIVLVAANKDGGAHVDANLTPEYGALAKDGAVGSFVYATQGQRMETPIQHAHLVWLRQLGYELLHSSDLLKLTND